MDVESPLLADFLRLLRSHWPRRKVVIETVKTVLFGAIGIQSCRGAVGAANLKPLHIIIAAIIFVVLFIFTLLTIVRIVTR